MNRKDQWTTGRKHCAATRIADRFLYDIVLPVVLMVTTVPAAAQAFNPAEWKFDCQRKTLAPVSYLDETIRCAGKPTLVLKGGGKAWANGHWYKRMPVEAGKYIRFRACFKTAKVDDPNRSVLARIIWEDGSGQRTGTAEYPAILPEKAENGWSIIAQTYKVPEGVQTARLELIYRWDADGAVHFGDVSLREADPQGPRPVRLATIGYRPAGSSSSRENLEKFAGLVAEAAAQKADIVCLPEEATLVGTGLNYISASEPVPGPSTRFLGELARKYHLYIVAGILERAGDIVYNTAVLINRNGELAGKYRKICLPEEEIDGGISPGKELPVFDTDFGRIGMMICWDVSFPAVSATLARQGAEVILMPIWGGSAALTRARAIENQVYLVSSSYDMISAVFDPQGTVLKETTKEDPVVVVPVDLNTAPRWPGVGDFRNRRISEMPPWEATGKPF